MNKPLSYYQYFVGNFKKTMSLIISIAFSIILLGSIHLFIKNAVETGTIVYQQFYNFTLLHDYGKKIDDDFLNNLLKNEDIEKVIPVKGEAVPFQGMAINSGVIIFNIDREDLIYLKNLLNLDINEEDIPLNDENKIILSDNLVKNNEYKLNSQIIEGKNYHLVTSFESNYYIGFIPTSRETLSYDTEVTYINKGYLIVPKENKLNSVNEYLINFRNDGIRVYDINYWTDLITDVTSEVENLFNLVTVIVLMSIGIGLGISTYVHYYQRRKEFGIINSLGFTDQYILLRINKEIIITSIIGFLIGILFLVFEINLINRLLLYIKGVPLYKLDLVIFNRVMIIPLFTSAFTLIPTWVLLKKLDNVSILEGVK